MRSQRCTKAVPYVCIYVFMYVCMYSMEGKEILAKFVHFQKNAIAVLVCISRSNETYVTLVCTVLQLHKEHGK